MDNARRFFKLITFFSEDPGKAILLPGVFLVAFLNLHCGSGGSALIDSSRQDILQILEKQQAAWNSGSVEGYMEGYQRSDSIRFVSGSTVTFGWNSTLDRYLKGYSSPGSMGQLMFSGLDVSVLSEDAAVVFGKWQLVRASGTPWGYFTLLFKRTPAGWRIVHDHTSSAP